LRRQANPLALAARERCRAAAEGQVANATPSRNRRRDISRRISPQSVPSLIELDLIAGLIASAIVIDVYSAMPRPPTRTAKESARNRRPPQTAQTAGETIFFDCQRTFQTALHPGVHAARQRTTPGTLVSIKALLELQLDRQAIEERYANFAWQIFERALERRL
jgi:hypothetical protein